MSYNPPANNAINFDLNSYTAPSNSSVNFEVSGAGPTAYVLNAEAGAFSLSGQAVGTRINRRVGAAAGAFTLSGQEVGTRLSRKVNAEVGSFTLSGQDVDLRKMVAARTLNAEVGVFTLSGQAVGLYRNRTLTADAREFILSGQEVLLKFNQVLKAEAAEYLLAGHDVSMYPPHVRIVEKFIAQSRAVTYTVIESSAFYAVSRESWWRNGSLPLSIRQSIGTSKVQRVVSAVSWLHSSQSARSSITRRSDAIWQTRYTSTSRSILRLRSRLTAPT